MTKSNKPNRSNELNPPSFYQRQSIPRDEESKPGNKLEVLPNPISRSGFSHATYRNALSYSNHAPDIPLFLIFSALSADDIAARKSENRRPNMVLAKKLCLVPAGAL
jgi:hypothetical protein